MALLYVKKDEAISLPEYQSSGAAGLDVKAYITEDITIEPGKIELIPTGLYLEIPEGYEVQVRSRSGLALKNGIIVLNSPGTIDSDYRGEVKVILMNLSDKPFTVKNGDRIAQIVLTKYEKAVFVEKKELSKSSRESGGFGSTGV